MMVQVLEVEANDITIRKRMAQWKISSKLLKLSGTSQIHLIKNTVLLLFQHLGCPEKGSGSVGVVIKTED